jgi:hypothetical protein
MEPTECSETSAFNIQTPGKYPEQNIPYLQHGEILKTTKLNAVCIGFVSGMLQVADRCEPDRLWWRSVIFLNTWSASSASVKSYLVTPSL